MSVVFNSQTERKCPVRDVARRFWRAMERQQTGFGHSGIAVQGALGATGQGVRAEEDCQPKLRLALSVFSRRMDRGAPSSGGLAPNSCGSASRHCGVAPGLGAFAPRPRGGASWRDACASFLFASASALCGCAPRLDALAPRPGGSASLGWGGNGAAGNGKSAVRRGLFRKRVRRGLRGSARGPPWPPRECGALTRRPHRPRPACNGVAP